MSRGSTTLYVTGFGSQTRARDLAHEFERYGRLVRCDIPAPRSAASRLFAFVEYESRRDADDAYHEMHNKRIGRDDMLKIEWARTPPSANWRFDSGSERERPSGGYRDRRRSPRRRSPSPRRGRDYSPKRDDRRSDRDYDRRDRAGDRSRSPEDRSAAPEESLSLRPKVRHSQPVRDTKDDRNDRDAVTNGDERKVAVESPAPVHDELDTAE